MRFGRVPADGGVLANTPRRNARENGDMLMFACFTCGETGHVKADCPNRTPKSTAPAPKSSTGPSYPRVPPRRPAAEIADAAYWAEAIRQQMGWTRGQAS